MLLSFAFEIMDGAVFHGKETLTVDQLKFYTHSIFKTCFVGVYTWSSDSSYAVLDIPDTVEGYRVTSLGGYANAPAPFMIIFPDAWSVYSPNALPKDAVVEQYHFDINIGRNLREDTLISMDVYHRVGKNRYAQVLVSVNCSEDNFHFYAEDGRLYRKSDGALVEGFFYASDYAH